MNVKAEIDRLIEQIIALRDAADDDELSDELDNAIMPLESASDRITAMEEEEEEEDAAVSEEGELEANPHQYTALQKAHELFGDRWKGKLKDCWMKADYPAALAPYKAELQQLRNKYGSAWLNAFEFDG